MRSGSGAASAGRGRDVRERLLGAASELISEVGWNAVTTRLLAERAGVTAGLVHYHFRSVQALLREAAVGVMREAVGGVGAVLAGAATPADGLRGMLASLDRYSGDDPTSLLFVEAYLAATRDELLRGELTGLVASFRREVAAWLAGHDQSLPEETAAVIAAAIDGMVLHRSLDPRLTSSAVAPVLCRLLKAEPEGGNPDD